MRLRLRGSRRRAGLRTSAATPASDAELEDGEEDGEVRRPHRERQLPPLGQRCPPRKHFEARILAAISPSLAHATRAGLVTSSVDDVDNICLAAAPSAAGDDGNDDDELSEPTGKRARVD